METKMQFITRMINEGECQQTKEDVDRYSSIYDKLAYWSSPNGKEEWKIILNRLEQVLRREIAWKVLND